MSSVPTNAVRRRGRPTRAAVEELNEHLLATAQRLFMAQGFEATSIEQLAEAAGVNKRTIYHRYPTKEAMFEAVVERSTERIFEVGRGPSPGSSVEDRLTHLVLALLDRALSPESLALMRIVIAESPRFPELARRADQKGRARAIARLAEALAEEARRQAVSVPDLTIAAEQLMGLTCALPLLRALMGGDREAVLAETAGTVRPSIRLFLAGCPSGCRGADRA